MPNYYKDIHNQTPLTKELIWRQLKADYNLKDADVTPSIKDKLADLMEQLIKNRVETMRLGVRMVGEYSLRNRIKKLFVENILTGDDLVQEIMQDIVDRKESWEGFFPVNNRHTVAGKLMSWLAADKYEVEASGLMVTIPDTL